MKKQIAMLLAVVLVFAAFNAGVYFLLTGRLSNNFSGTNQSKMVDVGMFLPHEEGSDLPRIDASLQLTGNLPVLDGAAALVPVYAAIIHTSAASYTPQLRLSSSSLALLMRWCSWN